MKKIILTFVFVLTTTFIFGQDISDVSQSGNTLTVRDEKNNYISSKSVSQSDELSGFSSTIILIRSGSTLTVYDKKFNYISSKTIGSNDRVKNVSSNNIIIKSGNTVTTYDKKFNYISSRSE